MNNMSYLELFFEGGDKRNQGCPSPKYLSTVKSNRWVAYAISLSGCETESSPLTVDFVDGLAPKARRETPYSRPSDKDIQRRR